MLRTEDLAYIGFVRKTHGYKGHLKIQIDLEEAGDLDTEQLFLLIEEKPVPFFIEELSGTTDMWIVKLEDIENDQEASVLCNCKVYVLKELIDEDLVQTKGFDINGYTIIDEHEGKLGIVTQYIEKNGQDLIEMDWNGMLHLIPVNERIITDVNHSRKEITVNLPEGLLALNS